MNAADEGDGRRARVIVLGSINMDLVARCPQLPVAGETLTATSFHEIPGGKGANQAVAASRAGAEVTLIGRVGDDGFAPRLTSHLERQRVDCRQVQPTADTPSGLALIAVSAAGENQIVVVPGANGAVSCDDVDRCRSLIESSDVLLVQLEVPLAAVARAIGIARAAGVRVILDPAPAPTTALPRELLDVDLICPNETEAAALTEQARETDSKMDSLATAEAAARQLHELGARAVVVTLGSRGALLLCEDRVQLVEPTLVTAIDTTAAGDAFAGAVAVRWSETGDLTDAVRWGNIAGGLAASRLGAQPSMATREEIERIASDY